MAKIDGNWMVFKPQELESIAKMFDMHPSELLLEMTNKKVRPDIQKAIEDLMKEKDNNATI